MMNPIMNSLASLALFFQVTNESQAPQAISIIQIVGAISFGALIGWYVYYINRYRRGDVQLSDLVTLVGVIGGSAVLALFPKGTDLFGAYGIGLAGGFFGYFLVLIILVRLSENFDADWFLDGRKKIDDKVVVPPDGVVRPPMRPRQEEESSVSSLAQDVKTLKTKVEQLEKVTLVRPRQEEESSVQGSSWDRDSIMEYLFKVGLIKEPAKVE